MKNEYLRINIAEKGAELTSIIDQQTGFEYLWQADSKVWGRHAPVLFPIVGKVKDDRLLFNGSAYNMNQHGFARDLVFSKVSETDTEIWYTLNHNDHTLSIYPFPFTLMLGYRLEQNTLTCSYKLINNGNAPLYFSIGAHPGFNLPTGDLTDYEIVFEKEESEERKLLSGGLFNGSSKPVLSTPTTIQLNGDLFNDDAVVFKHLHSRELTLRQMNSSFSIRLEYDGFPHLGIWTQKGNEQYLCLEPWCGHADPVGGHEDLSGKEGIIKLESNAEFNRSYRLTFTC